MANVNRFKEGCFCFYQTSSACEPMFPAAIELLAAQHGIPQKIVPSYPGDRAAVGRAIGLVKTASSKQGWVLTSIRSKAQEIIYGISIAHKDQELERVDHAFEDRLRWSSEYDPGRIEGAHQIAQDVHRAYQDLRGKIVPGDWTETLNQYLRNECQAHAMKDDGRVFYIPPQALDRAQALQPFLAAVGIYLILCVIETDAKAVVQQTVSESLAEQLQKLQDEVGAFDGTQAATTYRSRITEYQRLRKRATLYHEALNVGVEQAAAILTELESKVETLLSIRESIVIHKDGTADPLPGGRIKIASNSEYVATLAAQGEDAVAEAMHNGTLVVEVSALPASW